MDARAIFERVAATVGDAVHGFEEAVASDAKEGPRDAFFRAKVERLGEVLRALRDGEGLRFSFLQNLTAVDWPKREVFEVVYHLFSYAERHEICVKVETPRAAPHVPSVASLWPTANWLEREQFDLLGVVFDGHPDLRRILMPDDWVGHPMRKDYREPKAYRGMPTSRPSPLELLVAHDRAHAGPPAVAGKASGAADVKDGAAPKGGDA
jgi:NADH-quinone oxidoreductase subunit C